MTTFSSKLVAVGKEATDAIENFMADKALYWVDGYIHDEDAVTYDEDSIGSLWPKFYNDGDMNTLVGIDRNESGHILIIAILQMERYSPEIQSYPLDALPTECVCSIADDLLSLQS